MILERDSLIALFAALELDVVHAGWLGQMRNALLL